jgi:hypothetical protein
VGIEVAKVRDVEAIGKVGVLGLTQDREEGEVWRVWDREANKGRRTRAKAKGLEAFEKSTW